jgi:hypothetical protein
MTNQTPPKKKGKKVSFVKADTTEQTFEQFLAMLRAFGKAQGIKPSTDEEIRAIWDKYHPPAPGQTPPPDEKE